MSGRKGKRHDGLFPERRARRSRNVAERFGATRVVKKFGRAITTRVIWVSRAAVGAPNSGIDPGLARQWIGDSDPRRARGWLRARFALRLRLRNTEMAGMGRMRLCGRLCRHLLGAGRELPDRKRIVLLLRQRGARVLAGEGVAQPHHVLA